MKRIPKHKIAVILTLVLLVCSIPMVSYATSNAERLEQARKEKEELEKQQREKEEEANELKGKQKTLKGELKDLNNQMTEIGDNLEILEEKIREKEQEISDTEKALEEARELEAWQYECMKKRIQFMYEQNDSMYLSYLFSAKSFADFINFNEYFEKITAYDRDMLDEYEDNRIFIEGEEIRLNTERIELDGLLVEAEIQKSKVAGLISQTSGSIAKYGDEIDDLEAEALKYEAEIEDIEALMKKIEEEIALSQAAANAAWRDISEVSFADGDRYLLANLIYCEAGGEPDAGQLAVGAVVINRVLSSKYPDSVVGVIYQKKQFSPVASGRLELALASNKATARCYQAADQAMSGITNVGSCLYFRTPIEGLTGISIGGHIFY